MRCGQTVVQHRENADTCCMAQKTCYQPFTDSRRCFGFDQNINQQGVSHLILQVVLSVHLMIGSIKIVIGVIVVKHTAGRRSTNRTLNQGGFLDVPTSFISRQQLNIQLIDSIGSHQVREGRGRRRRRGRGRVSSVVVTSAPPQHHNVLEADVCLCGVVHTVWDGHQGAGGNGSVAGPVSTVH